MISPTPWGEASETASPPSAPASIEAIDLDEVDVDPAALEVLPPEVAARYRLLPLHWVERNANGSTQNGNHAASRQLRVALADPADEEGPQIFADVRQRRRDPPSRPGHGDRRSHRQALRVQRQPNDRRSPRRTRRDPGGGRRRLARGPGVASAGLGPRTDGRQPGESHDPRGGRSPGQRHPHRAVREIAEGQVPHRRHAPRDEPRRPSTCSPRSLPASRSWAA